jgi:hypothetical protein
MASSNTLLDQIQTYTSRISTNLSKTASRYSLQDYIRLVVIIGAYCLLRPYLIKLGGKFQAKDHEREIDLDELSSPAAVKNRRAVQAIRDQVPEDTDSEAEDEKGADWGRGARRRQRLMVRRLLEQAEKHKDEDEDDKDIADLLED